jgi:TPR repeat protein
LAMSRLLSSRQTTTNNALVRPRPSDLKQLASAKPGALQRDDQLGLEWALKAADMGDATAQGYMGIIYSNGLGVPKDEQKAFAWISKGAEQGEPALQAVVGSLYEEGKGASQSDAMALQWYLKAAKQGFGFAQYKTGVFYANGRATLQDRVLGDAWLVLATASSSPDLRAVAEREKLEQSMSAAEREGAAELAQSWRIGASLKRVPLDAH